MKNITINLGAAGLIMFITAIVIFLLMRDCAPSTPAPVAYHDSLTFWKNKYNQEVSRNDVLLGNVLQINQFLFEQYHLNDSLKNLLKADKNTSAAVYVSNVTAGEATALRNDSLLHDTIYIKEHQPYTQSTLPYGYIHKSKWINYNATAYPDSLQLFYSIYNEYVAKTHWQKGFLKKPIFTLDITNLNPNTKTKEQFSYKVEAPQKRLGLGIIGGIGIGAKPGYFIGLGVSYDLIQF